MEKAVKMPKVAKVKNKTPAEIQITAEQLLREAKERDLEIVPPPPKQKISDPEELADYQRRKRRACEDNIRKNRQVISNWIKYAQWEESQKEIQRARSIYERALDVDHRNIALWLKYTEMEMRNRQVNHARNLWDRGVTILPRANQFWYKYTYMEEMLGNIAGARQVFDRWMEWEPEEQAWLTYIKFELRYNEVPRAREIYKRFVKVHPEIKNWIKFAKFEESCNNTDGSRKVYEQGVEFFGEEFMDEKLFIAFGKFEETQKEHDRARIIYKYALDHLPKDKSHELQKAYTIHEKKYGDTASVNLVVTNKRKTQYEYEIKSNPMNYEAWFIYLKVIEEEKNVELVRDTYERAIANVPPSKEKSFWRRYIYLWIKYAFFEELDARDSGRARQVYTSCLDILPHKHFTFAKIWLYYAKFEIRQKNLTTARKFLGTALGTCPKNKLFKGYLELEIQLREFDRCRIIYQKFLEFCPENCVTWVSFAELETCLGDIDRARAIYELAVGQPRLDMPEVLWKSYIDFEISQEEIEKARLLYERLLERTSHFKVWLSYAKFEMTNAEDDENGLTLARSVYHRANKCLGATGSKEDRVKLLDNWNAFEEEHGDEDSLRKIQNIMPRKVKQRIHYVSNDGKDEGWEEKIDYVFPEDECTKPHMKLLEKAKSWMKTSS